MRCNRFEKPIILLTIALLLFNVIAFVKKRRLYAQWLCLLALLCLPTGAVMGGDLTVDGQVSAGSFNGDGSSLTNIPSITEQMEIHNVLCQVWFAADASQIHGMAPDFCKPYAVGDIGPAGGIVFYVGPFGLSGLEAATADRPGEYEWGCDDGIDLTGADGEAVGTGEQNTLDIVTGCVERPIAASAAANYSQNGFTDYFLPSIDELNLMFVNLHQLGKGGFADDLYWSSSELGEFGAFYLDFNAGNQNGSHKSLLRNVRPVRDF